VDIGFQFLAFNERRPPFDDPNFRKALSYAVDRDLILAAAWNGYGVPSNSVVSPSLAFWHNEGVLPVETGPEIAKEYLEKGGYELEGGRLHYPEGKTEELTSE
jgi:peptide/nickel transport system substrate-binding protein